MAGGVIIRPAAIGVGGVGSFSVRVELHQGDIQKLLYKMGKTKSQIFKGLYLRARELSEYGVAQLNATAPEGAGGEWARGEPPLNQSHRAILTDPYYVELISEAPHAIYIHNGFAPHMPPEEAWQGQEELSYPMRLAVLENATPDNPRPWFPAVARTLQAANIKSAEQMAATLFAD